MMTSSNVLDRKQAIHRNYLLEASAGTGKTFSIENIVVRLLLEEKEDGQEPYDLEKILLVTFTRAATRDLKLRIRANLEKSLRHINNALHDLDGGDLLVPDFLLWHIEQGKESVIQAKRRLEHALFCFDRAQIFTIHAFCSRMLREHVFEADFGMQSIDPEEESLDMHVLRLIRDFFRTAIRDAFYSMAQLKIVLQDHDNSIEKLEAALLKISKSGLDIEEPPHFTTHLEHFKEIMHSLKCELGLTSSTIIADFILQAPAYEKLCDRKRAVKAEVLSQVQQFAQLFDRKEWSASDLDFLLLEQIFIVEALDPLKLLATGKPPAATALHHPQLIAELRKKLLPLVAQASSPLAIFVKMAHSCQKMLRKYLVEEEKLGFDDLLKAMWQGVQNPSFVEKVRKNYVAVVIDEFQDTDPMQWEIFNTLFKAQDLSWDGHLYLVGDPKQSIYAFRQADIYTYLSAAEALGCDHHASLNVNYRSHPPLVAALNALFMPESSPGLISLPRTGKMLDYQCVKACDAILEKKFSDDWGSVHFCLAEAGGSGRVKNLPLEKLEAECFLPFFVQEIQRLQQCDGLHLHQFTVLVSDRFQAQRVDTFFKAWNIPCILQRSTSIVDSPALPSMRELLKAVLYPKHDSTLKTALGGKILGWTHLEVRLLEEHVQREKLLLQFYEWRRRLLADGFASFFHHLMHARWHVSSCSISERLLAQEGGLDFYDDLQQIAQLLLEEQSQKQLSAEGLLLFLDNLHLLEINGDERVKKHVDASRDAVSIITLHSSKGLEFDVVFALGLVKRTKPPLQLMPLQKGNDRYLGIVSDKKEEEYYRHCLECDAEKIRQLYVAMTRARYRLYVPVAIFLGGKEPELGCASPMELFLARLGQPMAEMGELYARIASYDGTILCNFIAKLSAQSTMQGSLTYCRLGNLPPELKKSELPHLPDLLHPPRIAIPQNPQSIYSFTALSQGGKNEINGIELENVPHDVLVLRKTPHHLPAGKDTGIVLHAILEKISFGAAKEGGGADALLPFIRPYVEGTFLADWEETICQIIFNTLRIVLHAGGSSFSLGDIAPHCCYREMEFLYPCNGEYAIEGVAHAAGFLRGIIDLLFIHEDRYYLVDWKSNWLGTGIEAYQRSNLESAMHAEGYFLQASIYAEALKRYLQLVDPRPFAEIFGGFFYLFVRGIGEINCLQTSNHGIYHFFPD